MFQGSEKVSDRISSYVRLGALLTVLITAIGLLFTPYYIRTFKRQPEMTRAATVWYASPNGSPSGDGSINHSWDLQTAFNGGNGVNPKDTGTHRIKPGDILYLRGGTYFVLKGSYRGRFDSFLEGTSSAPIIVRGYQGERAIIDGGINGMGSNTYFWGFEITNTNSRDVGSEGSNWPPRWTRGSGISFHGPGYKAINMIIYNSGHPGISTTTAATDSEIYGSIFWGVGNYDHDFNTPGTVVPRGSAWYTQSLGEPRLISDNISFRNLRTGGKSYGDVAPANGFIYDGNISFSNGDDQLAIDSINNDVTNLTFRNNYTYRRSDDPHGVGTIFGLWVNGARRNRGLTMQNNYLVNGRRTDLGTVTWKNFIGANISDNTIISRGSATEFWAATTPVSLSWTNNTFYSPNPSSTGFIFIDPHTGTNHSQYTHNTGFSQWANSVGASTSSNRGIVGLPNQNAIFVRKNKYEPCRGNIVVYNWQHTSSVNVDISGSGIVASGHNYKVLDAQNYFGNPVAQGIYNGGPITLPMNLTAVSPLPGITDVPNVHTANGTNEYAVFVIFDTRNTNCTGSGGVTPTPTLRLTVTPIPTRIPTQTPMPTITPGSTLTLNPVADTEVKSSTPTTNYGSSTLLVVDTTPDPIEIAYLKFDLANLTGRSITNAKLRLYITNGSTASQIVKQVPDTSWGELTVNYNNRPTLGSTVATITGAAVYVWKEIDVTSFIANKGGQLVSLGIDTANTDGISFHSKENINKPQLVITYGSITPLPTGTPTTRPTNTPTAVAKQGDANGDGRVDLLDYVIWLSHYGQTTANGPRDGDFNRDSKVDLLDYVIWLTNFGR